jgi:hypothetical protein
MSHILAIDEEAGEGQYAAMSTERPGPGTQQALATRPATAVREQAIERLSAAFAEGALDTEEFERRVTVAHRCATTAELDGLLLDLPTVVSVPGALVPATSTGATGLVPATSAPAYARTLSIFGSTRRAGRWGVPRRLVVRAVFGNVELDFRQAVLPAGVVELDLRAVFGNIEITVPPHLAVESSGSAVLGNFDHVDRAPAELAPDAPVLRISGTSVFGNVEITMRLPDDQPGRRLTGRK